MTVRSFGSALNLFYSSSYSNKLSVSLHKQIYQCLGATSHQSSPCIYYAFMFMYLTKPRRSYFIGFTSHFTLSFRSRGSVDPVAKSNYGQESNSTVNSTVPVSRRRESFVCSLVSRERQCTALMFTALDFDSIS